MDVVRARPRGSRTVRAGLLAGLLAVAMALLAACESTELTEEEKTILEQRREMIRRNAERAETLRKLQEQTARQFLEMELKGLQRGWMREALRAMNAGQYEKVLELVDRIFNPPAKREKKKFPVFVRDADGNLLDEQAVDDTGRPKFKEEVVEVAYPAVELEPSMEAALRSLVGTALFQLAQKQEDPAKAAAHMEACIAAYREAQKVDPGNRAARRNLGKILFQQARRDKANARHWYAQALKEWQTELAAGYRDAEIMILVGQALYENGHKEASARAFECAIPEMPTNRDLLRFVAGVYDDIGRDAEALRLYSHLLEKEPLNLEFITRKANLLVELGHREEAIGTLERLVVAGRMQTHHWLTLGDLYAQERLSGPAADCLFRAHGSSAATLVRTSRRDAVLVADLLIQANRPAAPATGRPVSDMARAETILRAVRRDSRAGKDQPDKVYADAWFTLGRLYQRQAGVAVGSETERRALVAEAVQAFQKSLKELDTNGQAWLAVADLSFSLGQKDFKITDSAWMESAYRAYMRASSLAGCEADGYLGLGDVLFTRGELSRAEDAYRSALRARPDDPVILNAIQAVEQHHRLAKSGERG